MSSSTNYASLAEFGKKHVTKGLGQLTPGVMTKAQGSYVTFGDGREMLDFTCGIGVTNLGSLSMDFVLIVFELLSRSLSS